MGLTLNFEVKQTEDQLQNRILGAIRDHLNTVLPLAPPYIEKRLQELLDGLIRGTPEYNSLLNGQLQAELGLPDPDSKLNAILHKLRDSVKVTFRRVSVVGRADLQGGLRFQMVQNDFQDILQLAEAVYDSKGNTVPWLSWLITKGDSIILLNYDILYTPRGSRTGQAIVIKKAGSAWRVPPAFSGVLSNNFITRALDINAIENQLLKIVEEEVKRRL